MNTKLENTIDETVVKVAAYVLGTSDDDVRNDTGMYAAYHWDDFTYECTFEDLHWSDFVGTATAAEPFDPVVHNDDALFGRADFDIGRSVVMSCLEPLESTDKSLMDLISKQNCLFGAQVAQAIVANRLDKAQVRYTDHSFHGRIWAKGTSVVDAFRALLRLNDFPEQKMAQGEYSEVDEEHETFINSIENPALRDHIANFFQCADSARCTGAALDGVEDGSTIVASWWIGEGQGDCFIEKLETDEIADIPAFDGYAPIYYDIPETKDTATPSTDGLSTSLPELDLSATLAEYGTYKIGKAITESQNPRAFLAGIAVSIPAEQCLLSTVIDFQRALNSYQQLIRPLWQITHELSRFAKPEHAFLLHWIRADCLHQLRCLQESNDAYETALSFKGAFINNAVAPIETCFVYTKYASLLLALEKLDAAIEMAQTAIDLWEQETPCFEGLSVLGFAKVLNGDVSGYKHLETCFEARVNPEPPKQIAVLEAYKARAMKHSISLPRYE